MNPDICSEDCSKLNTQYVKYICKNGKCVEDPLFNQVKTVANDIEAELKKDVDKLSPTQIQKLVPEITRNLTSIINGDSPAQSASKVVNIVSEGLMHIKEQNSNILPQDLIGLYTTAMMLSPSLGKIFSPNVELVKQIVGPKLIENLKTEYSSDANSIGNIISTAKNFLSTFFDSSQLDSILYNIVKSNPNYAQLIENSVGNKKDEIFGDMPKIKSLMNKNA